MYDPTPKPNIKELQQRPVLNPAMDVRNFIQAISC